MPFNNIAIDDGCVTGSEYLRNVITGTNGLEITDVFDPDPVAVIFQVGYPVTTATSEAMLVNRYLERVAG